MQLANLVANPDEIAELVGYIEELLRPVAWHEFAACRGDGTADHFGGTVAKIARAKALCSTCEVRPECLGMALRDRDLVGVWGGCTESERRVMRRELGVESGPELFACGHCGNRVQWLSSRGCCPLCERFAAKYSHYPPLRRRVSA